MQSEDFHTFCTLCNLALILFYFFLSFLHQDMLITQEWQYENQIQTLYSLVAAHFG